MERSLNELWQLVDSPNPSVRSHRIRLNELESNDRAVELAKQVMHQHGATADLRWRQVREWATLMIAILSMFVTAAVAWQVFGAG